jgi:hypothetical protein
MSLVQTSNSLAWPGVEFTKRGLTFTRDLEFTEWENLGQALQVLEQAVQWYIGDWLVYGERAYGDLCHQGVEMTGRAAQTLSNCAWVAGHVPPEVRREELSFTHHSFVASLPVEEQAELLSIAESECLTTREFSETVKDYKRKKAGLEDELVSFQVTLEIKPTTPLTKSTLCQYLPFAVERAVPNCPVSVRLVDIKET